MQKAENTHTVAESVRIDFTRQLMSLRDGDKDEISFSPSLDSTQRKYLHSLAGQLGLKSRSVGKNESRFITVSKSDTSANLSNDADAIPLKLNPKSIQILKKALAALPIDHLNVAVDVGRYSHEPTVTVSSTNAEHLKKSYEDRQKLRASKSSFAAIQSNRSKLPSFQLREEVCKMVKAHQIILVSGETGCGKTTQVPQFLLDDPEIGPSCRMIITQPRRLSAITVAERISAERDEKIGTTVGYNIRFESEVSNSTQVLFVTPGVLLRKLQSDPELNEYTHILIDEAHERDRFTEFLFIILKDLCLRRQSVKLILMSATLNTSKLSAYFGGLPQINMGGSVFPVAEYYLEDILKLTDYVVPSTAEGAEVLTVSSKNYYCSVCGGGPFKIAAELGGHAALCRLPPGGTLKVKRDQKSVRQLQAMISSIFAHNSKSIEANQAPHVGGASVSGVEVEEGDDVSDDGSDTDTVDEDVAAKEVIAIQAFDPNRREPEVEDVTGDPSLRQYQRTFDDSLVDYELMYQLLIYVFKSDLCKDGCVLVFLPGWDDISNMSRMLRFSHEFGNTARFKILQLHSTIPRKDQAEAFLPAGKGVRKIILSTNIAETSITIDDVSVVIDTGKVKEISYDPHVKLAYLKTTYVSKASARQRRGRAGRTRAGACFHMFSKTRHSSLAEFQDSELLRMPLEELVLQTKMLGLAVGKGSVEEFLGKAMDPPHELSIVNALDVLRSIQCLNENEELTVIGQAVGKLPIEPKSAYTILLGSLMGLGDEAVKAIAAMSRDPFVPPVDDKMRAAFNKSKAKLGLAMPSDQFSLLKALDGYLVKSKTSNNASLTEYCERNFLSRTALTYLADVSQQMNSVLDSIGMNLSHPRSMRNSGNTYLLISVLSIGLYPSIGVRRHGATLFTTEKGPKAKIHPSSVNYSHSQYKKPCAVDVDIVGFDSLISTKPSERNPNSASLMMLSTTPLSVLAVILACAEMQIVDNSIDETSVLLIVDDWLKLRGDRDVAKVLQAMRECLVEALVRFVRDPARPLPLNIGNALEAVCSALTIEQQDVYPRQGPVEH